LRALRRLQRESQTSPFVFVSERGSPFTMIRPDGTQPAPQGFTGPAESIPWGLNVDGNDDMPGAA
jgi:hypothetical protein